jgi:moderate conductance mechanosensitive channel
MLALLAAAADAPPPLFPDLAPQWRIAAIVGVALGLHLLVGVVRRISEWIVTPATSPELARDLLERRRPRIATVTTLVVSGLTFIIYFTAVGLILREVGVNLRTYFASATVIGLAVGFGSQGLVQDVVIGLTLIFSDAFDVGDVVEISGQVGRVEKVGLRFTTLSNFIGQTVYIPNRNIGVIGRFRRGAIRAFIDVQLPAGAAEPAVVAAIGRVMHGVRAQHPAVVLAEPELLGPVTAEPGGWRYLRVKLRVWPGQGPFVESAVRQRLLGEMRGLDAGYADWMVTVTYRVA